MNKRLLKKKISRLDDEVLIDLYLERRLSKKMRGFVSKEVVKRFHIVHSFAEVELDMLQQMLDGEDYSEQEYVTVEIECWECSEKLGQKEFAYETYRKMARSLDGKRVKMICENCAGIMD